jgi:hypothetical protein
LSPGFTFTTVSEGAGDEAGFATSSAKAGPQKSAKINPNSFASIEFSESIHGQIL